MIELSNKGFSRITGYFQKISLVNFFFIDYLSFLLQERGGKSSYEHSSYILKYKLDNEFELVFVVAYQKILQLSYIDKFLDDIQLEFRDKYKNVLSRNMYLQVTISNLVLDKFLNYYRPYTELISSLDLSIWEAFPSSFESGWRMGQSTRMHRQTNENVSRIG